MYNANSQMVYYSFGMVDHVWDSWSEFEISCMLAYNSHHNQHELGYYIGSKVISPNIAKPIPPYTISIWLTLSGLVADL